MGVYPTSKKGEPDIEIRFNGQIPPSLVFLTNCIIKHNSNLGKLNEIKDLYLAFHKTCQGQNYRYISEEVFSHLFTKVRAISTTTLFCELDYKKKRTYTHI